MNVLNFKEKGKRYFKSYTKTVLFIIIIEYTTDWQQNVSHSIVLPSHVFAFWHFISISWDSLIMLFASCNPLLYLIPSAGHLPVCLLNYCKWLCARPLDVRRGKGHQGWPRPLPSTWCAF